MKIAEKKKKKKRNLGNLVFVYMHKKSLSLHCSLMTFVGWYNFGTQGVVSSSYLRCVHFYYYIVYSILKIMVQLYWLYSELEDQQVSPPT